MRISVLGLGIEQQHHEIITLSDRFFFLPTYRLLQFIRIHF